MVDQDGATELTRPVVGQAGLSRLCRAHLSSPKAAISTTSLVPDSPDRPYDGGADEIEIKIDRK